MKDFEKMVIDDVIPTIERMILKEKNHLEKLRVKNSPIEYIERSEKYLNHYEERYNQYKDFFKV